MSCLHTDFRWAHKSNRGVSFQKRSMAQEEDKKTLRKECIKVRDGLPLEIRERGALLITERILGHQWYYLSDTILGFSSFGSEIDTTELLEETLRQKKRLFLPKVEGKAMDFYQVKDLSELKCGYKGILEPSGESVRFQKEVFTPEKTLLLMPGVAFDLYGNRLGYGGGFYDRFLKLYPELHTRSIAIGFAAQRVPEIPVEAWDSKPYQTILV